MEPLQNLKARMQKGELADFEFTTEMKQNVLQAIQSGKKGKKYGNKFLPTLISAALIVLFFGGLYQYVISPNNSSTRTTDDPPAVEEKPNDNEEKNPVIADEKDEEKEEEEMPPPDAVAILTLFDENVKWLFDPSQYDSNYKYKNFKTKQEFLQQLTNIATLEFLEHYYDGLLEERADGLYVIPRGYRSLLDIMTTYDLQKISETKYQFTQEINNELDSYKQTVIIELQDGFWKITEAASD